MELGELPVIGVLVVAIAVALAVIAFLPFVVFVLELLIVVPLVVAYRVLLGKPWTLEAVTSGERKLWHVPGWRASRRAVPRIAAALARGESADSVVV